MMTPNNTTATVKPDKSRKTVQNTGYAGTPTQSFSQPIPQIRIQQKGNPASQALLTWSRIALLGFILNFIIIISLL